MATKRKKLTKLQRATRAHKASVERRVSAALRKFISLKNPGRKVPEKVRIRRTKRGFSINY